MRMLGPGGVIAVLVLATSLVTLVSVALGAAALAARVRRDARARERKEEFRAWQEHLRAVLYDDAPPETFWRAVGEGNDLDVLWFLVEHVRRLGGAERERVRSLAKPYLPGLAPQLRDHRDARRQRAVQTLGELGLPAWAPEVVGALDDPSPLVAMVAANTLAHAETPEYARAILARAGRFSHWRRDFLAALFASVGSGAAPALRAVLDDPGSPLRVRAVAADALALIGDPRGADAAAAALASTDDVELRAAALRLLAAAGRSQHVDVVRREVGARELPVRLAAIRALGQLGDAEDEAALRRAATEDPSPWVALAAARALRAAGAMQSLETLAGSDHPRSALGLQVLSEARSL